MDGVLIVDKPEGLTSFDVVRRLRRLGRGRKAGHTGTLDPLATGVLPVCLGDATKIATFLTDGDKEYRAVVKLGAETDTYDATGRVLSTREVGGIERDRLDAAVAALGGEYWQTPPMFSAVKVDGRRLYELARRGETTFRKPRKVRIERIELEAWDPAAAEATIFVRCSKGTYIRSIAHELGEALGVGGHLRALRRLRSGPFPVEDAIPLAALLDALSSGGEPSIEGRLVPMRQALPALPEVRADAERARKVAHGMVLGARDLAACGAPRVDEGTLARITGPSGDLLAVAEMRRGVLRYRRVLVGSDGPDLRPNDR